MKDAHFGFGLSFCPGETPSVAVNGRGNVVVVHEAGGGTKRYRVGRLSQATIAWGECRSAGSGRRPRVALNNDDIAVEVHWNPHHKNMYCRAGRLGAAREDEVAWPYAQAYASGGNRDWPAVALNDAGVVVEVHEVHERHGRRSRTWLEYGVGQVKEKDGQPVVHWRGERFRHGEAATPAIAIDRHGTVVEVHRYPYGNDRRLFYRVGRVKGAVIEGFERAERRREIILPSGVRPAGFYPSVAITDDGLVVLVYRARTQVQVIELIGQIEPDGETITWKRHRHFDLGTIPSVAVAGNMAVEVHQHETHPELRFSTSLITDRASWMEDRLQTLGPKRLRDLCLPASHDAGMYVAGPVSMGYAVNQNLTIYQQLVYGIRYFELRPMWRRPSDRRPGRLEIHHGGWSGPDLATVLNDVKNFASEGHRELVILKFSHFRNFDAEVYDRLVSETEAAIGRWLVRSTPRGDRLADVTLSEYVTRANDGPAILVVVDQAWAVQPAIPGFWVYSAQGAPSEERNLRVYDVYTNTPSFPRMRRDQFEKFAAFDGSNADLFLLSWTLTPGGRVPPPTPRMLSRVSNPRLGQDIHLGEPPAFEPPDIPNKHQKIINLLFVDFVETARVTDIALLENGERVTIAGASLAMRRAKPRP